jgi:cytochrome c oxidase cbb3-type subunit 3
MSNTPHTPEDKNPQGTPKGPTTTGHSWDGIEEYNNPLPRWWLWVFYVCIAVAVGYAIYYPSLPHWFGISHWNSRNVLNTQMKQAETEHAVYENQLAPLSPQQIDKNPDLRAYAIASGKALFAINCSQCHGAGGAGAKGFPNLLDDEWLHGGSLSAIAQTITHGVRATDDPKTRDVGPMAAWGKEGLLTVEQIEDVVNYLSVLAYDAKPNESTQRGQQVFADNCATCHGDKGQGMREFGAPPLNNEIWLYGGSHDDRVETVTNGRAGVMPSFAAKLNPQDINKLAVYVHSLGGGEAEAQPIPVSGTTAVLVTPSVPAASPTMAVSESKV